jgi:hypothetical protein
MRLLSPFSRTPSMTMTVRGCVVRGVGWDGDLYIWGWGISSLWDRVLSAQRRSVRPTHIHSIFIYFCGARDTLFLISQCVCVFLTGLPSTKTK